MVRYAAATGLCESPFPGVLEAISPLLADESFYVRRAAATTAISLHDKKGIDVLLETLQYDTLDTEDNYGNNLFNTLAKYVGVNFGLSKAKWLAWWDEAKENFVFPEANEKRKCLPAPTSQ